MKAWMKKGDKGEGTLEVVFIDGMPDEIWRAITNPDIPYVAVTPWADHEETQAAIGEATEALEFARKRIAGKKQHAVIDAALARLRALGGQGE